MAPSPSATQPAARMPMPARIENGTSCASRGLLASRQRQERNAEGLHEAGRGQRRGERQQRAGDGEDHAREAPGASEAGQQRLVRQPFADEAVERRQAGNGHRADQKTERRHRHAADEPAHLFHVARARGLQNGAGAQKQQALEDGVVQRVVEARDQRDGRQRGMAERAEHQRRAEADQDDADVLDAVIRQQALEVVLHQRVEHAQQRREHARRQHQHARP